MMTTAFFYKKGKKLKSFLVFHGFDLVLPKVQYTS